MSKLFERLSVEGDNVDNIDVDQVEVLQYEEELPVDISNAEKDILLIKEAEETVTSLEESLVTLSEDDVDITNKINSANENYKKACYLCGLKPDIIYSNENNDRYDNIILTTETIKDTIYRIIEAIKNILAKLYNFIKKTYIKVLVLLNNDAKKLEDISKELSTLDTKNLVLVENPDKTIYNPFIDTLYSRLLPVLKVATGKAEIHDITGTDIVNCFKKYNDEIRKLKQPIRIIKSKTPDNIFTLEPHSITGNIDLDKLVLDKKSWVDTLKRITFSYNYNITDAYLSTWVVNVTGSTTKAIIVVNKDNELVSSKSRSSDYNFNNIKRIMYVPVSQTSTLKEMLRTKKASVLEHIELEVIKGFVNVAKESASTIKTIFSDYDSEVNKMKKEIDSVIKLDELKQKAASGELNIVNNIIRINSEVLLDNIKSIMYNNKTMLMIANKVLANNK